MSKGTVFSSAGEVNECYLPNNILDDLGNNLCSRFGLNFSTPQCKVSKNKDNLRTGFIKIIIPNDDYSTHTLHRAINHFYLSRSFSTGVSSNSRPIFATKDKERFRISLSELENSYLISISEDIFKSVKLSV